MIVQPKQLVIFTKLADNYFSLFSMNYVQEDKDENKKHMICLTFTKEIKSSKVRYFSKYIQNRRIARKFIPTIIEELKPLFIIETNLKS